MAVATAIGPESGDPKIEVAFEDEVAVSTLNLPKGELAVPERGIDSSLTPELS